MKKTIQEIAVKHKCKKRDYCICNMMASEPNENCPIHGHGEWPPRCVVCGRFVKWTFNKNKTVLDNEGSA